MDDGPPLTERRPAGMSTGVFRAVIVIVIALLLINLYAITLVINPILDDEDDDGNPEEPEEVVHIWNVTVESEVIREDTTWTGRSGLLMAPVVVEDGATLRLVDCHIQLLCEDFILFRQPYFTVEEGGSLVFEGSVVELVYDPWLDTTLVGPTYGVRNYPFMSRVVNLTDTQDPRVEFDVKWKGVGTELVVAVQPTPGGELVTHEVVEPTGEPTDWLSYSVSLSGYAGSSVNVVLYFPNFPEDVLFVHDLLVTDGGEVLPNDLPLWDSGFMPYWERSSFVTFDNAFLWYGHLSQVILAQGDVSIANSTVSSDLVPRRGDDEYYKMEAWHTFPARNIWAGTSDWHIWMDGAKFRLHDSALEHMPVEANDSWVEVESSDITSQYDMFTLFESGGTFANSSFESDGVSETLRWWHWEARPLWAISLQNNSVDRPVSIRGCKFEGVAEAIDLDNSVATVRQCVFKDVVNLTMWSHNSTLDDWATLNATNMFMDGPGFHYFESLLTYIEVNASERRGWSTHAYDPEGVEIDDWGYFVESPYGSKDLLRMDGLRGWLVNPQLLVESHDTIRTVDHTNISMDTEIFGGESLDGTVTITVRPDEEAVHFDAYPVLKEEQGKWWEDVEAPMRLASLTRSPYSMDPGDYNLWWVVNLYNLYAFNITFDVVLDGSIVQRWNETDIPFTGGSSVSLEANISLSLGEHVLELVVSGEVLDENMTLSEEPLVINRHTHGVMRVDNSTPASEVRTFLTSNKVYLLMDAGTDLVIEGMEPPEDIEESWYGHDVTVVGSEGASLTLEDSDYLGRANLSISYFAPLDIHVTGGSYELLYMHADGPQVEVFQDLGEDIVSSFRVDNTTTGSLFLYLYRCSLEIADVTNHGIMWLDSIVNSSVSVTRSDLVGTYGYVSGPMHSFSLTDCRLSRANEGGFKVSVDDDGEVTVRNCTFDGTWMYIGRGSSAQTEWRVSVTECEFRGDGAMLALSWEPMDGERGWRDSPSSFPVPNGTISDNTFSGEGVGILLHHRLYEDFLGENALEDDAGLWAWYRTEVRGACSDPSVGGYTEVLLREGPPEFVSPFRIWEWPNERDVLLRVTDDPDSALDPPRQVALLSWSEREYYGPDMVMGSGLVDLTMDSNVLYHTYWPELKWTLHDTVEPWPIPMDLEG